MSDNILNAVNQQATEKLNFLFSGASETTRRAPLLKKEVVAYLIGALHDATFNKNKRFRFSQKGTGWLIVLKNLLNYIGYNSWIYKEGKNRNIYVLETLANFLDFKFNPLTLEKRKEKESYIRGFFDAEGGIPHKKNDKFYIQLVQKDKEKLKKIKIILEEFDISTGMIHNPSRRVDPNYWRMYVLTNSHIRFKKIISSWHPLKNKIFQERMMI